MMKKLLMLLLILFIIIQPPHCFCRITYRPVPGKISFEPEPVIFTFGDLHMDGVLEQAYPFTEAEIDKLVQETLKAMNLTQLDIMEANKKVEKAKRASEFTKEDLERVKKNMLTTISAVPAGNVTSVLSAVAGYMGSSSSGMTFMAQLLTFFLKTLRQAGLKILPADLSIRQASLVKMLIL